MIAFSSVVTHTSQLEVTWQDGMSERFSYFWLRDNARDNASYDARSHQRMIYTAGIDRDITPLSAHVSQDRSDIEIIWPDSETPSLYNTAFLRSFCSRADNKSQRPPYLWQQDCLPQDEIFCDYKHSLTEAGLLQLLNTVHVFGFAVVDNCPQNASAVSNLAQQIGYIRQTIFGGLWEFEANEDKADSAYTGLELRPHTDGTYSSDAPGLQLLLCVSYDAEGGDSVMVDGFCLAQQIKDHHPDIFSVLSTIDVTGQYCGDGVMLEASRPVFRCKSDGSIEQVSFNNYDRKAVKLKEPQMTRLYDGICVFDSLLNDNAFQWRYGLRPGQMLVFDNWRCLHGRAAFKGKRKMAGAYINREDYISCLRVKGLGF